MAAIWAARHLPTIGPCFVRKTDGDVDQRRHSDQPLRNSDSGHASVDCRHQARLKVDDEKKSSIMSSLREL
jgi:hypothetical protein